MSRSSSGLAHRYARALFQEIESSRVNTAVESLQNLRDLLKNESARTYLLDPTMPKRTVLDVIRNITGEFPEPVGKFVELLVFRRRLFLVDDVERALRQLDRHARNQIEVSVDSAIALGDEERKPIADFVREKTGREPSITVAVDSSLIAGVVVTFDDYTLDLSIKGRLKRIRSSFEASDASAEVV